MAAAELFIPRKAVQPDGFSFEISSLLGSGAFAKCHAGLLHDPQGKAVGKAYALKIVRSKLANRKVEQKFITELQIHSKIRHPNIVEFERAFSFEENTYVVLELCTKGSLQAMVKRRKSLTMPEVRRFLIQICGAVKYIHQNNVAHRDLKVGNIFLDSNLNAKIGDFGLAALLLDNEEKPTRRVTMCGTPNYLAPEIVTGKKRGHNEKVDLWAIGVVAFVLSVGQTPFNSSSREEIYRKLQAREYKWPSASDSVNEIPTDLHDLVASLLVDEDRRPKPDEIVTHEFFKMAFIPPKLEPECLYKRPSWPQNRPPTTAVIKTGYSPTWKEVCSSCGVGEIDGQAFTVAQVGNLAEFFKSEIRFNRAPIIPMPEEHMYLRFSEDEIGGLQDVTKPARPTTAKRKALVESIGQANKAKLPVKAMDRSDVLKVEKVRQTSIESVQKASQVLAEDNPVVEDTARNAEPKPAGSGATPEAMETTTQKPKRQTSQTAAVKRSSRYQKGTSLQTLRRNLVLALNQKLHDDSSNSLPFIEQWVDYSKRHWIQYRLDNGSVGGIYLKSSPITYMLLQNAQKYYSRVHREPEKLGNVPFEFFRASGVNGFSKVEVDEETRRTISERWMKMCSRWFSYGEPSVADCPRSDSSLFVTLYQRLGNVSVWGFTDGSFQFNFPDHTKLVLSAAGTHSRLYALPVDAVSYLSSNAHLQTSHLLGRAHLSYPTTSLLCGRHRSDADEGSANFEDMAQANNVVGKIKFIVGVAKQWIIDEVSNKNDGGPENAEELEAVDFEERACTDAWRQIRWKGTQEALREKDMRWMMVGKYAGSIT